MKLGLGKGAAVFDRRTIPLKGVLKAILPPLPASFNVRRSFGNLQFPEGDHYGNAGEKPIGNCVAVAKYLHQMSFEAYEQGKIIPVTTEDIVNQYNAEADGYGLIMLDSAKQWRKKGLPVGRKKFLCVKYGGRCYKCHAFASVDMIHMEEIKASIALMFGLFTGLMLPLTAQDQFNNGKIWDVVDGPGGDPGSWGGHGVYTYSYAAVNEKTDDYVLECYTWGQRQLMTRRFMLKYCDERYAVIDAANRIGSPVDEDKLESQLIEISR